MPAANPPHWAGLLEPAELKSLPPIIHQAKLEVNQSKMKAAKLLVFLLVGTMAVGSLGEPPAAHTLDMPDQ